MVVAQDPYRPPDTLDRQREELTVQGQHPNWLRFRWHLLPPVLIVLLAVGEPIWFGLAFLPMIILCHDFGPWVHPINLLVSILVVAATPGLQIAKMVIASQWRVLAVSQLALWWVYWLTVAAAVTFGTYRGP